MGSRPEMRQSFESRRLVGLLGGCRDLSPSECVHFIQPVRDAVQTQHTEVHLLIHQGVA